MPIACSPRDRDLPAVVVTGEGHAHLADQVREAARDSGPVDHGRDAPSSCGAGGATGRHRSVVRARWWQRRIESGRAKSITDLAEQEGVTVAYVCRLLPLTCLA
jgi:hypothetical protein